MNEDRNNKKGNLDKDKSLEEVNKKLDKIIELLEVQNFELKRFGFNRSKWQMELGDKIRRMFSGKGNLSQQTSNTKSYILYLKS